MLNVPIRATGEVVPTAPPQDTRLPLAHFRITPPAAGDRNAVSARVNMLFARYVAIEAEQARLGALGTRESDAQADALAAPALAIMEQIMTIRDRTGCADLIAARILLDLMLVHPWQSGDEIKWSHEETTQILPLLECVADRTSGAVRIEARRALATIGVDMLEEANESDPLLAFVTAWTDAEATLRALPVSSQDAWSAEHIEPLDDRALRGDLPRATTEAGAVAALRRVATFPDIQTMDANLLKAALAYFDA